jgi:hypothetical protein
MRRKRTDGVKFLSQNATRDRRLAANVPDCAIWTPSALARRAQSLVSTDVAAVVVAERCGEIPMQDNKIKAVYQIIEHERLKKPIWRRIGTAFLNRDESLNIEIESFPVGGKMHVRDFLPRDESEKHHEAA